MRFALFALLSVSVLLFGCIVQEGAPLPAPSVAPTPAEQPITTPTPVPTATATATAAPTEVPTAVPTAVPTEVPTPTPETVASPSPVAQGPTATITIQTFAFIPPTLEISAGTTVTWINNDDAEHNVRSVMSSQASFVSYNFGKGGTYSVTFNYTGAYGYYSGLYPDLMGNIIVT